MREDSRTMPDMKRAGNAHKIGLYRHLRTFENLSENVRMIYITFFTEFLLCPFFGGSAIFNSFAKSYTVNNRKFFSVHSSPLLIISRNFKMQYFIDFRLVLYSLK